MKKIILSLVLALTVSLVSIGTYAAVRCGSCTEKCCNKDKKCDKPCDKNKKCCSSATSANSTCNKDAKSTTSAKACCNKDAKSCGKMTSKQEAPNFKPADKKAE